MMTMGMMEDFKANMAGNKAYRAHAHANRLSDSGRADEAEKLYADAMRLYIQAEQLGCKSSRILTGYSVLLMRTENFEKAKQLISKVYEDKTLTADDKFHLCLNHALCQWRLGALDKALSDMELCGDHHKTGLYYDIMSSLLIEKGVQTGDFAPAEDICTQALNYDDEDGRAICAMGLLRYYQGNYDEAKKLLSKSSEVFPSYPASRVGLALVAKAAGDVSGARAHIEAALKLRFPTTSPLSKQFAEQLKRELI